MAATTEAELTPELIAWVKGLSPKSKDVLHDLLEAELFPPSERSVEELMAELVRRADETDSVEAPSMTVEQVRDHVRVELAKHGVEL